MIFIMCENCLAQWHFLRKNRISILSSYDLFLTDFFFCIGACLGGLVIIVLAGYFIARMRANRQGPEDQERIVQ